MKINIHIDPSVEETRVDVRAPTLDAEVRRIESALTRLGEPQRLTGTDGERTVLLDPARILRLFTRDKRVYAHDAAGTWRIQPRLHEVEHRLQSDSFIRINQGEIINLAHVAFMDLSGTGTIAVQLRDGTRCFVSRRSIPRFKAALGL
ncbi:MULTISPECIES: LytTR family DNA-binding domain-containing protein [Actinomyces]|uniref:LytTR family transcriptional regulator DNA-binding domain-containing protein n=1 Tax=Actinomyces respiraculi TaxID=2744574 RepID=A0A7T0LKT7_9ACTO|nr:MULTISPECIES: LytTR family DNA-binding domain-containing protein [Actinomyces]QPL05614.1 LytTR family transcriptional regulator DNA-binding domain-containing protein [Actinomyces respiraculi]